MGDNVAVLSLNPTALYDIRVGTAADPDISWQPTFKVSRTAAVPESAFASGDGSVGMAAIYGSAYGLSSGEAQVIGVLGTAKTDSSAVGSHTEADACGIYGRGRSTSGSTRAGIGGFFEARRDNSSGRLTGVEVSADNETASDGIYSSNTPSGTMGIWLHPNGQANVGVGLQIGTVASRKFAVGIGVNQNAIVDSTFRDDSSSTTSLDIRGTHTTALSVGASAGPILLNEQSTPSAPSANQVRLYAKDNGAGKTQVCALFSSGAEQVLAIQP